MIQKTLLRTVILSIFILNSCLLFSSTKDTLILPCQQKQIKHFKRNLNNYSSVKCIKLIGNSPKTNWEKLFQEISKLDSVTEIILVSNEFTQLPMAITNLHKLKSLTILDNEDLLLDSCIEQLSSLSSLKKLSLELYTLKELPKNITQLTNIDSLILFNKTYDSDSINYSDNEHLKKYYFDIETYKYPDMHKKLPVVYITAADSSKEEVLEIEKSILNNVTNYNLTAQQTAPYDSLKKPPFQCFARNYQSINPPFKNVSVEKKYYTVDPTKENKIIYTRSGTEINIPSNSFVDEKGNPVNSNVIIDYREFRDAADFIVSGIPMTFTNSDSSINFFQSAGMFEMNASQNGKELFLKPGAKISMNFVATDTASKYNFYSFNDKENIWIDKGKNTPKPKDDQPSATPTLSDAYRFFEDYDLVNYSKYDSALFSERFEDKKYIYTKRKKQTDNITIRKRSNFFFRKFNFFRKKDKGYQKKAPPIYIKRGNADYKVNNIVKIRGIKKDKNGNILFNIRTYYLMHPEMSAFASYRWKLTDNISVKDFRSSFSTKNHFNDIRIEQSGDGYTIKLKGDSTIKEINAKTVKYVEVNKKLVLKEISPKYKTYAKTLAQRERTFNRNVKKGRLEDNTYYAYQGSEKRTKEVWHLTKNKMNATERKMSYEEWLSYCNKINENEKRLINASAANTTNLIASLRIDGFGIFNCDQIQRLQEPLIVFSKYKNAQNEFSSLCTYIVDKKINGVLSYYKEKGAYDYQKIAFGKNSENTMIVTKEDGSMLIFTKKDFSQNKFSNNIKFTFSVTEINTKVSTVEDVRKALNL